MQNQIATEIITQMLAMRDDAAQLASVKQLCVRKLARG